MVANKRVNTAKLCIVSDIRLNYPLLQFKNATTLIALLSIVVDCATRQKQFRFEVSNFAATIQSIVNTVWV